MTEAASESIQTLSPEQILPELRNLDHDLLELQKQFVGGQLQSNEYENRRLILRKKRSDTLRNLQQILKSDPEKARQLRFQMYVNRSVQLLLSGFLGGMIKELVPNFDSDRKARYPILENLDGVAASVNQTEVLDELAYAGILEKKLYERLVCCPKCGSHSAVFLRLKCPECGSVQFESSKLIEHLVCGGVHEFEEFANGDQIKCPSCGEPLIQEGEDFRVVGTFNRCESCRIHFDVPTKKFACRTCQEEFEAKDATYYDTYTYSMNGNVLTEVKGMIGLPVFKSAVEEAGFKVELPGTIVGTSGMIHNFTLTGNRDGTTLAIDLVESENEVDEKELFAFYTKILDIKSTFGVLVAIPRMSVRAKEFATKALSRDHVTYIEADGPAQAMEQLKDRLRKIT